MSKKITSYNKAVCSPEYLNYMYYYLNANLLNKNSNKTPTRISTELGISASFFTHFKSRQCISRVDIFLAIADYMNVGLDEIFGRHKDDSGVYTYTEKLGKKK